jgi:SRSO17 transposase
VKTIEDQAVAAPDSVAGRWRQAFEALMQRVAGRFARVEPRRHARALVLGLMSDDLPRKNCWTIAEHAGHATPAGLQHLLDRAKWDADAVRDDVRDYVVEHLADARAVLVVDETGDLKKGTHTVGVQRQYTGTAGRIENAQVAVYLTYTSPHGHAGIDRAVYLPKSWTADPPRCAAAGVPEQVRFATKPALAARMILAALDAGVPAAWAAGDNPHLRAALEAREFGYVLAVSCSHRVPTAAGGIRADALAKRIPKRAWHKLSAGAGAKGRRYYDWALIGIDVQAAGHRQLLIRRNRATGELAYYRCYSPTRVPLAELVRVAGSRWTVEEFFQSSKGLAGLDEHQVRQWHSWHRWVTLAMLAQAFLAVTAALERHAPPPPDEGPESPGLIALTCNEIQRLFTSLIAQPLHDEGPESPGLIALTCNEIQRLFTSLIAQPLHDAGLRLRWSRWRRRHQARARDCHYRRQAALHP